MHYSTMVLRVRLLRILMMVVSAVACTWFSSAASTHSLVPVFAHEPILSRRLLATARNASERNVCSDSELLDAFKDPQVQLIHLECNVRLGEAWKTLPTAALDILRNVTVSGRRAVQRGYWPILDFDFISNKVCSGGIAAGNTAPVAKGGWCDIRGGQGTQPDLGN